jgi:hypothetical protein
VVCEGEGEKRSRKEKTKESFQANAKSLSLPSPLSPLLPKDLVLVDSSAVGRRHYYRPRRQRLGLSAQAAAFGRVGLPFPQLALKTSRCYRGRRHGLEGERVEIRARWGLGASRLTRCRWNESQPTDWNTCASRGGSDLAAPEREKGELKRGFDAPRRDSEEVGLWQNLQKKISKARIKSIGPPRRSTLFPPSDQ